MLTIVVPLLVCLVGGVVHYASAPASKFKPLALWAFGVGLWWTLAEAGHHVVHLGQ